jgi:hypothetical protein
MQKICSKCKVEKELNCFHKDAGQTSGYRPDCKICAKERQSKYLTEEKRLELNKKREMKIEKNIENI